MTEENKYILFHRLQPDRFEISYFIGGMIAGCEIEAWGFETFKVGSCLSAVFFDATMNLQYAFKDVIYIKIKEVQTDD